MPANPILSLLNAATLLYGSVHFIMELYVIPLYPLYTHTSVRAILKVLRKGSFNQLIDFLSVCVDACNLELGIGGDMLVDRLDNVSYCVDCVHRGGLLWLGIV